MLTLFCELQILAIVSKQISLHSGLIPLMQEQKRFCRTFLKSRGRKWTQLNLLKIYPAFLSSSRCELYIFVKLLCVKWMLSWSLTQLACGLVFNKTCLKCDIDKVLYSTEKLGWILTEIRYYYWELRHHMKSSDRDQVLSYALFIAMDRIELVH